MSAHMAGLARARMLPPLLGSWPLMLANGLMVRSFVLMVALSDTYIKCAMYVNFKAYQKRKNMG